MYNNGNSSKNVTGASVVDGTMESADFPDNGLSGDKIDGGIISNFQSTGIDDRLATAKQVYISDVGFGINTTAPVSQFNVEIDYDRTDTTERIVGFLGSNDSDFKTGLVTSIKGGTTSADRTVYLGERTYTVSSDSFGDTYGVLALQSSGGKVGVCTDNPTEALEVGEGKLLITQSATAKGLGYLATFAAQQANECLNISVDGNKVITTEGYYAASSLILHSNGIPRMTIESTGDVVIGSVPSSTVAGVETQAAGRTTYARGTGTGPFNHMTFKNGNGSVGYIQTSASHTSYLTSSDYRLKENVVPMAGSIDRLKSLNPSRFNFIGGDTKVDGFLAHEAGEVVPECSSGTKDGMVDVGIITDADGNTVKESVEAPEILQEGHIWTKTGEQADYQGIDQSKLVPLLVSALQEAITRIEQLENN
jgi:hypothetical protein